MTAHTILEGEQPRSRSEDADYLANSRNLVEQMRRQAQLSRLALDKSRRLIAESGQMGNWSPVDDGESDEAREGRARRRLLTWEAEDLSMVVPEEITNERRQFAIALYETIRLAASLGMSAPRLRYHVEYAWRRYEEGE